MKNAFDCLGKIEYFLSNNNFGLNKQFGKSFFEIEIFVGVIFLPLFFASGCETANKKKELPKIRNVDKRSTPKFLTEKRLQVNSVENYFPFTELKTKIEKKIRAQQIKKKT